MKINLRVFVYREHGFHIQTSSQNHELNMTKLRGKKNIVQTNHDMISIYTHVWFCMEKEKDGRAGEKKLWGNWSFCPKWKEKPAFYYENINYISLAASRNMWTNRESSRRE